MSDYVGLDVSKESTSICIIDENNQILREDSVPTDPDMIGIFLKGSNLSIDSIGLESGPFTHFLVEGLQNQGFKVVVMESLKVAAILKSTINKTDRNDARGIAMVLKSEHYTECVQRSNESMHLRTFLNSRETLVTARFNLKNTIHGLLRPYGIKVPHPKRVCWPKRVVEAVKESVPTLTLPISTLVESFVLISEKLKILEDHAVEVAKQDEDATLLQTVDGVGPVTALQFKSEVDDITRFKNARDVGAYLGLTPRQYSSGETQRMGRISKRGTAATRLCLVRSATVMLTLSKSWSKLKAWAMKIQKKKGFSKAKVALARKLAVTMFLMLRDKRPFKRSYKGVDPEAAAEFDAMTGTKACENMTLQSV